MPSSSMLNVCLNVYCLLCFCQDRGCAHTLAIFSYDDIAKESVEQIIVRPPARACPRYRSAADWVHQ